MLLAVLLQAAGDGAVHVTLGGGITALIVHTIYREFRDRPAKGNGNGNGKPRCSVEDAVYWDRMRENVTRPIVEAVRDLKK